MNVKTLQEIPPWEWPDGTAEILLEVLQDQQSDAADRLVAAELAGDFVVVNEDLVAALLEILRSAHEAEDLRGNAAIALGPVLEQGFITEFDDPDDVPISEETFDTIRESLRALYADGSVPDAVRRRILEASVRAPDDWHADAVRAAYARSEHAWKLTGAFCMRFLRGFDAQILAALESGDPELEYEAVCAAGNWELGAAWPHVAALVTSENIDKALLLAAIEAVGCIRPHEAADILDELTNSDDEDIADAANEALAMAGVLNDLDDEDDEDDD